MCDFTPENRYEIGKRTRGLKKRKRLRSSILNKKFLRGAALILTLEGSSPPCIGSDKRRKQTRSGVVAVYCQSFYLVLLQSKATHSDPSSRLVVKRSPIHYCILVPSVLCNLGYCRCPLLSLEIKTKCVCDTLGALYTCYTRYFLILIFARTD